MKNAQNNMDKTAIALSLLCMAHCLLLPVAMVFLPAVFVIPLQDELFHKLLVIGVLPISILALTMGCRKHNNWTVFLWGVVGIVILALTAAFGHDYLGEMGEKLSTLTGAMIITFGHTRNFRLCRTDRCNHC